jgi:uncharacterized membrane protein (UPF0127 family)
MKLLVSVGVGIGAFLLCAGVVVILTQEYRDSDRDLCFAERCYTAEIVADDATRERGLSGRPSLCSECAMLFVFPDEGKYGFWMKGMRFPLDIVWVDGEGTVVHIERAVLPESTQVYLPGNPARYVIELNAGAAAKVRLGDHWQLPR